MSLGANQSTSEELSKMAENHFKSEQWEEAIAYYKKILKSDLYCPHYCREKSERARRFVGLLAE